MAKDLDGSPKDAAQRSHDHTDAVHQAYDGDHKKMWDGYGIIADVIPFTSYFPRANIHELLSPDLLHQIIKGTFKDHLVQWVVEYLEGLPEGKQALAEMDRRIALAPPFSGLRRFPEGRGFKQWTGNDSKALMKVFLAAIKGLVPDGMVRAISAFMEFCYLVRLSEIDELVLDRIDKAVEEFHQEREIFRQYGIRQNFNLPRQHSLCHYRLLIQQFGAPNGLCSSITESKHIEAVKKAWRRSSRNKPLGEMLLTNQRIDKLAAARVAFEPQIPLRLRDPRDQRQTLQSMRAHMPVRLETISEDEGEGEVLSESAGQLSEQQVKMVTSEGDVRLPRRAASRYPRPLYLLTPYLGIPRLEEFIRRFLYDQLYPDSDVMGMDIDLEECPVIDPHLHIKLFKSATVLYHAPSDVSGIAGMSREVIRATPSWQNGAPRHDCVLVELDPGVAGFAGMNVAQVQMFLSFKYQGVEYQAALVRWFEKYGEGPCNVTALGQSSELLLFSIACRHLDYIGQY
ncbi:hypothetical protein EST38_g12246 [Candolleomyces aberdarensis]|uniref:Uncharacterized protein n=1 Tax=Candolleomyces aberdarensis TaxID=2316362 RepID=A0A4Q2D4Y2_9AGAR|nr:hypothetical protein EST38_g12246 [Candolleomyces aberdarensis]